MENYQGKPIVLNKNTIILLHLFHRNDSLNDLWMHDMDPFIEANFLQHKKAAKELLDSLDGHWCISFLENLIEESFLKIKNHDKEFGTNFYQPILNKINQ